MQDTGPAYAQAFGGCVAANRGRGQAIITSWLYGVTLRLLRDALATGGAEPFALRFLQAFPREFARPMLILALSGSSYVACSLYLCKPASSAASDISLSADSASWVREHLR
ncbi:hypothetical protein ACFWP0_03735 [Achromobacter sp. NPDC058515]|uniref:hypothetical protein n=1 Tax=Achromobacter sp. NPDC058515 TaxID=3346533 RepID=UPI00364E7F52